MHQAVNKFLENLKQKYPQYFKGKKVLEMGSLDINGTPRYLFEDCAYVGVDRTAGAGVDVVGNAHEINGDYDVVITTEMLEHDKYARQSIINGYELTREIFIATCANMGRLPHYEHTGEDNHYKNISREFIEDIAKQLKIKKIIIEEDKQDIRFVFFK